MTLLGRELVKNQSLRLVRDKYGLSRSAQAHMIGVPPTALRLWEDGSTPSRPCAARIANWYQFLAAWVASADEKLLDMVAQGELIHVTVASQRLAMSYSTITEKCRTQVLRCYNLGPLGVYVHRDQLGAVHANRQS